MRQRTPRLNKVFDVVVLDDEAGLVWSANLSAIELHPYLGTAAAFDVPTAMVFDLDPGPPADVITCCDVALVLRRLLDGVGLQSFPKVSGGKGLHIHVPVAPTETFARTKDFAHAVAGLLTRDMPGVVVGTMARSERPGRVFVDWSQNDPWKSIIAPYSLRGLEFPTVAAPVTWAEVEQATVDRRAGDLVFLAWEMPERLAAHGDLFEPSLGLAQVLPS